MTASKRDFSLNLSPSKILLFFLTGFFSLLSDGPAPPSPEKAVVWVFFRMTKLFFRWVRNFPPQGISSALSQSLFSKTFHFVVLLVRFREGSFHAQACKGRNAGYAWKRYIQRKCFLRKLNLNPPSVWIFSPICKKRSLTNKCSLKTLSRKTETLSHEGVLCAFWFLMILVLTFNRVLSGRRRPLAPALMLGRGALGPLMRRAALHSYFPSPTPVPFPAARIPEGPL